MGGCASVPIKFKRAGGVPPEPAMEESIAAFALVEEQKTAVEVNMEVEETKEEENAEIEKEEDEQDAPSLGTVLDKDGEKKEEKSGGRGC